MDFTFALRQLVKNPAFAAITVLTLALGIGGTTAIFSALYAVVLKPLPLDGPERLFDVGETYQGSLSSMSAGVYVDAETGTTAFDGLAAEQFSNFSLSDGSTSERVVGGRVTANYFAVMGARPLVGRTFTAEEDQPGRDQVVVLSHRLWVRQFGSAPMVGRDIRLNGVSSTVVGIMPPSFDLTLDSEELWTPIAFTPERRRMHDEHYLAVYGRLKPGVTRERAQAELDAVAVRVRREYPKDVPNLTYSMAPFQDRFVGDYRRRLLVLMAAVAVVLLIACGNVANLLLARGAARAREIAIRSAIGASRSRIVRQLLTESVVLGVASAAAGVLLAHWAVQSVVAWSPPGVPRLDQARVDGTALVFAASIALASSILCGLAPALRLAGREVQAGLHDSRRGATSGGARDRLRAGLIVAEVALSLLLLVGAGLLIRSAIALQRVNPGFDPTGVLSARLTLPATVYQDPEHIIATYERLAADARNIPGVTHAAVTSYAAMGAGGGSNGLVPEGREPRVENAILSTLRMITPEFFQTMRIPIVRGRAFDATDRRGGQKVMIVSETLAARAFPGQNPIGKRIACCESGPDGAPAWKIVVGVAGDVRSRGPAEAPRPEFYLPIPQAPDEAWTWIQRSVYILTRTDGDPATLVQPLRSLVARINPDIPLFDVRQMNQRLAAAMATARFNTLLLSLLGGIGLLLAATGIYGVVAYLVTQRTQEIGVRMALGATRASVIRLVLGQVMQPVAIGGAIGLAASFVASRAISNQLFGVSRTDPLTIGVVAATLMIVALVASALPARRAATIDPTRALQSE